MFTSTLSCLPVAINHWVIICIQPTFMWSPLCASYYRKPCCVVGRWGCGGRCKIGQIQTCLLRNLHLVMVKSWCEECKLQLEKEWLSYSHFKQTGCESYLETKKYKLCARRTSLDQFDTRRETILWVNVLISRPFRQYTI